MIVGTGAKHCFVRSGSAEPGTRAACATPAALLRDTGPRARTPHPHPVRGRVRTRPLARVALTGMGLAGAQEGLCWRGASRSSMPRTGCPPLGCGLRPAQRGKLPRSQSRAALRWDFAASSAANFQDAGLCSNALELRRVQRGQLPWRRAARCRVWDFAALTRQESAMRCTPAPGRRCGRCCRRPRARARKARRAPALSLALALALASAAAREPRRPRPGAHPVSRIHRPHLAPARLLAVHEHAEAEDAAGEAAEEEDRADEECCGERRFPPGTSVTSSRAGRTPADVGGRMDSVRIHAAFGSPTARNAGTMATWAGRGAGCGWSSAGRR